MKEVTPNSGQGLAKKVLFQEQEGGGEKGGFGGCGYREERADVNSAMQSENKKGCAALARSLMERGNVVANVCQGPLTKRAGLEGMWRWRRRGVVEERMSTWMLMIRTGP